MFEKLGIADAMKDKARKISATPVGEIVARGEAEIGFQQISELKPVKGIEIVGPLPAELQKITVFSAGLASNAPQPDAGKALIAFLSSKQAAPCDRGQRARAQGEVRRCLPSPPLAGRGGVARRWTRGTLRTVAFAESPLDRRPQLRMRTRLLAMRAEC